MKSYRIDKSKYPTDILEVTIGEPIEDEQGNPISKDSLDVHFADGRVYTRLENEPENIAKIHAKQEKQVEDGISILPRLKRRRTLGGITRGIFSLVGTIAAPIFSNQIILPTFDVEADTVKMAITGGILAVTGLAGAIGTGVYLKNKNLAIDELEKLKYRNDHSSELNSIDEYPNSLVGLSQKQIDRIESYESDEDPFNVGVVDSYTKKDLETIVSNVEREKEFGFQYVHKNSHTK